MTTRLDAETLRLVDLFDEAAQRWGWEADQGVRHVKEAMDAYDAAKEALIAHLVVRLGNVNGKD